MKENDRGAGLYKGEGVIYLERGYRNRHGMRVCIVIQATMNKEISAAYEFLIPPQPSEIE